MDNFIVQELIPDMTIRDTLTSTIYMDLYKARSPISDDTIRAMQVLQYFKDTDENISCLINAPTLRNTRNLSDIKSRTLHSIGADSDAYSISDYKYRLKNAIGRSNNHSMHVLLNTNNVSETYITHTIDALKESDYVELPEYALALVCHPTHKVSIWYRKNETEHRYGDFVLLSNQVTQNTYIKFLAVSYAVENVLPAEIIEDLLTLKFEKVKGYVDYILDKVVTFADAQQRATVLQLLKNKTKGTPEPVLLSQITETQRAIARAEDNVRDYYARLHKLETEHTRLVSGLADNYLKLAEYIATTNPKSVTDLEFGNSENTMLFAVRTPVKFWEDKPIKILLESKRENRFTNLDPIEQQLIRDIFINKTVILLIELRACIHFNHTETGEQVVSRAYTDSMYHTTKFKHIPHPHIYFFNCWGDNMLPITKAFNDGEYDLMFAQIQSTAASLNTSDNAVMNRMLDLLFLTNSLSKHKTLMIKETGELLTVREYLQRLKDTPPVTPLPLVEPGSENTEVPTAQPRPRRVTPPVQPVEEVIEDDDDEEDDE